MSLQYYDSDNEALIPIAGNVNPSDVIELKATKADKTQISNRNLLDNSWFTINQRGFVGPNDSLQYTVDRWRSEGGTVLSNGVITQTKLANIGGNMFQDLEPSIADYILGKVLTISILMADGTIHSATATAKTKSQLVNGWQRVAETLYISLGNTIVVEPMIRYNSTSGEVEYIQGAIVRMNNAPDNTSISFKAIKLELGSVSTLALDTAPNYTMELLKCQRYFYRAKNSTDMWAWITPIGFAFSTDQFRVPIVFPVAMRTIPTVSKSGLLDVISISDGTDILSDQDITGLQAIDSDGNRMMYVIIYTSRTLTVGAQGGVRCRNNSAYIDFSADL